MPSIYATQVHARLKAAAAAAGVPCASIDTICPDDMVVVKMMSLCRASGVSYSEIFATRASTASTVSPGSKPSAAQNLMKLPNMMDR